MPALRVQIPQVDYTPEPDAASVELPEQEISFNDTDGDAVVFRRKTNGKIDVYVNGDLTFSDLTSLERGIYPGGKVYIHWRGYLLHGKYMESGACKPRYNDSSVIEKVLALYRGDQPQVKLLASAASAGSCQNWQSRQHL